MELILEATIGGQSHTRKHFGVGLVQSSRGNETEWGGGDSVCVCVGVGGGTLNCSGADGERAADRFVNRGAEWKTHLLNPPSK